MTAASKTGLYEFYINMFALIFDTHLLHCDLQTLQENVHRIKLADLNVFSLLEVIALLFPPLYEHDTFVLVVALKSICLLY